MNCVACGHDKMNVIRTTEVEGPRPQVVRTRHCPNCSLTIVTVEEITEFMVMNPVTMKGEWFELEKMDAYMDVLLGKKKHPNAQDDDEY